MGKTYPFTQFYPTGFTQWVKHSMPILHACLVQSAATSNVIFVVIWQENRQLK